MNPQSVFIANIRKISKFIVFYNLIKICILHGHVFGTKTAKNSYITKCIYKQQRVIRTFFFFFFFFFFFNSNSTLMLNQTCDNGF